VQTPTVSPMVRDILARTVRKTELTLSDRNSRECQKGEDYRGLCPWLNLFCTTWTRNILFVGDRKWRKGRNIGRIRPVLRVCVNLRINGVQGDVHIVNTVSHRCAQW